MALEDYGQRDSDLVLPPQTYAYVLDSTKGKVSVGVGPFKSSLSNTDKLVVWNPTARKFAEVNNAEYAIQVFASAGEGEYVILDNPESNNGHPTAGTNADAAPLEQGRKVNIPGPVSFALWPGQVAQAIEGHHLRHNQYLIVRVYDPAQAQQNWSEAVVATQGEAAAADIAPTRDFAMGQLIVIKGTDVSFYIPPTGIEVVPEAGSRFVREAVTLEQLEYCILLDENGEKRFVKGPDVVFPSPTETFVEQVDDIGIRQRKFRAIELNPHAGIFVKVVDEYEENGETHQVGEELFITGETDPIYFPRAEHSIIKYGSKTVHHAVAIPEGEGRYVLDRDTGEVNLVTGPKMFLPDPRTEVVVLRILDPHVAQLLYPGNHEAEAINSRRAELSGRLNPEEYLTHELAAGASVAAYSVTRSFDDLNVATPGETIRRGTAFTPPRSIVLDTKYDGAVTVNVWPGYAVLVTDKSDHRRVELGPKSVLLEYDETLMPLTLSTGRPKDDKRTLRTAYLRVVNNQVSDRVVVETGDLVEVTIDVGYRVNFLGETQGEQQKWFAIENYVKVLTDHCRSRLRNVAKRHDIDEFYGDPIDIIRDALLGESVDGERPGMSFDENNMKLYDVEVLSVPINDPSVSGLLLSAQQEALRSTIELATAQARSQRLEVLEELKRSDAENQELTRVALAEHVVADVGRKRAQQLAQLEVDLATAEADAQVQELRRAAVEADETQALEFARQRQELDIQRLKDETESYLARMEGIDENLITAIQNLGDKNFVEKLTEALGPVALASGITTAELFGQIFRDTPFAGLFDTLAERPALVRRGAEPSSMPAFD
jgi:major vault protein